MSGYGDEITLFTVTSTNPKAPMYRASIRIGGVEYEAPIWPRTRRDGTAVTDRQGNPIIGGKIVPAEARPQGGAPTTGAPTSAPRQAPTSGQAPANHPF